MKRQDHASAHAAAARHGAPAPQEQFNETAWRNRRVCTCACLCGMTIFHPRDMLCYGCNRGEHRPACILPRDYKTRTAQASTDPPASPPPSSREGAADAPLVVINQLLRERSREERGEFDAAAWARAAVIA